MPTVVTGEEPLTDMSVANFISKHVDLQVSKGKTQRQIAQEIGYEKPNMISMLKSGEAKVPFAKIPALAKALDVDLAVLFNLVIQQDRPDVGAAIAEIFGAVLTKNEREMIDMFRDATKHSDPALTPELKSKIETALGSGKKS